jgi:polysaccharide export outer membrane protein
MNATISLRGIHAFWFPVFLFTAGAVAALGQDSRNAQQTSNQAGSSIAAVSRPVQPTAGSSDSRSTLTAAPVSKDYKIGIDDVLTVNVWHETELSRNVTVRPDGKISLPLVGEIQAAGKTPPQLEAELSSDLAQYIKEPELTVIVAEIRSRRVNIIGQVVHPGTFAMTQQMGVLDVIAEAGGLKDFAKKKQIYVLRETSAGRRIRLDYDYRDVVSGKNNAQDILLQADDTVVVP